MLAWMSTRALYHDAFALHAKLVPNDAAHLLLPSQSLLLIFLTNWRVLYRTEKTGIML